MSRRIYRLLLRLYSRDHRERFGPEMEETFLQELAEARSRGWWAATSLWVRTVTHSMAMGMEDRLRWPRLGGLLQDLRFAVRVLVRNPGFSLVVAITMALGIGATTTIFSVVHGVLLQPLPYADADELMILGVTRSGDGAFPRGPVFPSVYADWEADASVFESMSAVSEWTLDLVGEGEPQRLNAAGVSASFLGLLGVELQLGQGFSEADDQPEAAPVLLLSDALWQTRWGGDPGILGERVTLSGVTYTVVGVLPRGFRYPEAFGLDRIDVLYPYRLNIPTQDLIYALGRLRPGVTAASAADALDAVGSPSAERGGFLADVIPLRSFIVGDVGMRLRLLLGAVGLLLLIASANVANLFLARATGRNEEMGLRTSLGAGRGRILGQLLVEALVLAAVGGALGVAVAAASIKALAALDPGSIPRMSEVAMNGTVLFVALGVTAATGVLFGLVPAAQLGSGRGGRISGTGARSSASPLGRRLRAALVSGQVALALVLLVGAGLLIRSFVQLQDVDPGFDPRDVAFTTIILDDRYAAPEEQSLFFSQVLDRVGQSVPGVTDAGVVTALPMSGDRWRAPIVVEGYVPPDGQGAAMDFAQVSEGYFQTLGTALLSGRTFAAGDAAGEGPTVLVVNESFARQYWGDQDPLGRRVKIGRDADGPGPELTVIGVVADVRQRAVAEAGGPQSYIFYRQMPSNQMRVVVKSGADPALVAPALRQAVWDVDPAIPVEVTLLEDQVSGTITGPRFYATLLTAFAGLALVLAAVGLYGTLSYVVGERRREMGIRVALGAGASSVRRLVVRQGAVMTAVGVIVGLAGAVLASRLLEGLLYATGPMDPAAFAWSVVALAGVSLLASYVPALRATRADPMVALREE